MLTMRPDRLRRQRGFALVTGIFLLLVLAALGAAMLSLGSTQQAGEAADIRGMRAYQAARAGADWAAYKLLDPNNVTLPKGTTPFPTPTSNAFVACSTVSGLFPAAGLAGSDLSSFAVTVACSSSDVSEGGRIVRIYQVSSTASSGNVGALGHVERRIALTLAVCRDPSGDSNAQPPYGCI